MRNPTLILRQSLILATAVSALAFSGCNRVLPMEPEDAMAPSAMETSVSAKETSTSTSTSTRRRPARTSGAPTSKPPGVTPTIDPTAPPPTAPPPTAPPPTVPPPTVPPPTTPPPTVPPPTATTDCIGPCDGILRIPSNGEVMAAMYAARDRVKAAVDSGEIKAKKKVKDWNKVPNVEWKACFFWVENGFYYDANGNKIVGACAAGMTDFDRNRIVISTKEEHRTLALVKWEATNYYLYLIGRKDLADRFQ